MKANFLLLTILFITVSCSKDMLTTNSKNSKITLSIPKKVPSIIFFSSKKQSDEHKKISLRFHNAFGEDSNFPVKDINDAEIVEFQNAITFYFQNSKGLKNGMILSDGLRKPFIEYNAENYVKSYEDYFNIELNDDIYYREKMQDLKKSNLNEASVILKSKFNITTNYAKNLLKYGTSIHMNAENDYACNEGKVICYTYSDSLKTKKTGDFSSTTYRKNLPQIEIITNTSANYFYEIKFYYNKFNLIDSTETITTSKGITTREKAIYIYQKDCFSVINIDKFENRLSIKYQLNSNQQCISSKTINDSGSFSSETFYKYDELGRLIEITKDEDCTEYIYETYTSKILSNIRIRSCANKNISSNNTFFTKNGYYHIKSEYKGKLTSYSKILKDKNGCTKLAFNYDGNKKFQNMYEYIYE